jgi:hypothetical protein
VLDTQNKADKGDRWKTYIRLLKKSRSVMLFNISQRWPLLSYELLPLSLRKVCRL